MEKTSKISALEIALTILLLASFGGLYFLWTTKISLENEKISQQKEIEGLKVSIKDLENNLNLSEEEKKSLAEGLQNEKDRLDEFEADVRKATKTVGTLEKLSKTDKELLQKYSKVYFLNENYVPSRLTTIKEKFTTNEDRLLEIHASVAPYLSKMLEDAEDDGVNLRIISAFRSFGTQAVLKNNYKITYGTGSANAFSADQGYSEHQLATTVDITTAEIGSGLATTFDTTEAFTWLQKNAYKYGFTLSYPKGNNFYVYEPWHWRFVGKKLAEKLHDDNKYFYDLDQREIDKYLVNIFD